MSDRELLKLAAKAAGIEIKHWIGSDPHSPKWRPFTDDGDALRLAVKLKMNIQIVTLPHAVYVKAYDGTHEAAMEPLKDVRTSVVTTDPLAATRRAIVRAAAEIGRMK